MFGNLIKATFYIRKNKLFEKVREFSLFATILQLFLKDFYLISTVMFFNLRVSECEDLKTERGKQSFLLL